MVFCLLYSESIYNFYYYLVYVNVIELLFNYVWDCLTSAILYKIVNFDTKGITEPFFFTFLNSIARVTVYTRA